MTRHNSTCRTSTARASHRCPSVSALLDRLSVTTLILCMLCLGLWSCSGGAQQSPTPAILPTDAPVGTAEATAQPSPSAPAPQPTPSVVELKVWIPPGFSLPEGHALAQAIDTEFGEASANLRVTLSVKQARGKGGMLDLLTGASQVAPTFVPDLVLMSSADAEAAAQAELVQPLDSLAMPGWVEGVFPNLASLGVVGGVRYGIPFGVDLMHLAYRASLTVTTPITWGSVSGSGGHYLFVPGGFEGSWRSPLLLQYLGAGGALRDAQGQKTALSPTVLAQALSLYKELYDSGVLPEDILSVTSADAAWAAFAAGEADFIEVAASEALAEQIPGNVAFAAVPTLSGTPVTTARGWVWVIPARSPDRQQAAVQFLDWVLAPERERAWCEAARYLAAARGAWLETSPSPYESLLASLLQVAVPLPGSLDSTEAASALQDALTQVLTAEASPQQAAQRLANVLNE